LNLFGNGFYAATKRARGNGEAAYTPDPPGLDPRSGRDSRGPGA
jgi:hypothetical protein